MENNNVGIIIQARTGSTRMPKKVILPFYKDLSILDILLNRLKHYFNTIPIIVATSNSKNDDHIFYIAEKHGVSCFRGSEENVLLRMIQAAKTFGVNQIIRVCADNPFLNIKYLLQLVRAHKGEDYVSFQFSDGSPIIKSHLGLFAEATTLATLNRVSTLTKKKVYIEHVTNFIYTHSELFSIKWLPLPTFLDKRKDLRFTTDTLTDFTMYQTIYSTLIEKHSFDFTAEDLVSIVDQNVDFLEIMNSEIKNNTK